MYTLAYSFQTAGICSIEKANNIDNIKMALNRIKNQLDFLYNNPIKFENKIIALELKTKELRNILNNL